MAARKSDLAHLGYVTLEEMIERLPPARQAEIAARAKELIAEEMALRDLRKAMKLTQVRVARKLKVGQDAVSRIEQRSDLMLSTLRKYVQAMGGDLVLTARFPDRPPVELAELGTIADRKTPRRTDRKSARA